MSDTTILAQQSIELRAGDDLPGFAAIIEDNIGNPVDLTGANVYFQLRSPDGWVLERETFAPNPSAGQVTFDWDSEASALLPPGNYHLSVRAAWPDGDQLTAPSDEGALVLSVRPPIYHPPLDAVALLTVDREVLRTGDDQQLFTASAAYSVDGLRVGGNTSAWNTGDAASVLNDMRRTGSNQITLAVQVAMDGTAADNVQVNGDSLAFCVEVAEQINRYDEIILEPYPWVDDGAISETDINPSDPAQFFADWQTAIEQIIDADWGTHPIAGVYIASNLVNLETGHQARWVALVDSLRADYPGVDIIYRTNWWTTATWDTGAGSTTEAYDNKLANPIFGLPDIIAISAYFELTESDDPDVAEITSALSGTTVFARGQNVHQEVMNFRTTWGKPIMFGELGCPSVNKGAMNPWNPDVTAVPNDTIQAALFQAYIDVFGDEDGFRGFSAFSIGIPFVSNYTLTPATAAIMARSAGT